MERKIVKKLIEWKKSKYRKPLILQGARQVGKTYIVNSFGKEYYDKVAYFNFEDNEILNNIFERDLDTVRIISELEALSGQSIIKERTLIFLDEIQICERAITSLKYFNENNNEYHVIAAGSLLGVYCNRKKYSFPVGKVDFMTLYPLDFEEFLMANGHKKLIKLIRSCYENDFENPLHQKCLDIYRQYLLIGGMPDAVKIYIETEDYNMVNSVQKNIRESYLADMTKYADIQDTIRIKLTYESISKQLAKENKKFQYKYIKSGARSSEFEVPIEWLQSSGIVMKCTKIKESILPLIAYTDIDSFKIYITDTGMLSSKYNLPSNAILTDINLMGEFKGALTENYVATSLKYLDRELYYWESEGKAEIDFIVQDKEGNIIPIEVKSSDNTRSKSLQTYKSKYNPKYSIRITSKNFGFENNIKSVPLYAVYCMEL